MKTGVAEAFYTDPFASFIRSSFTLANHFQWKPPEWNKQQQQQHNTHTHKKNKKKKRVEKNPRKAECV